MIRRRLIVVFLPAMLLLTVAAAFAWLLRTEHGARWVWNRTAAAVPGLEAESVAGTLRSGLTVRGLSWRDESTQVTVDRANLELAFALLPPAISVESLRAGAVEIVSTETGDDPEPVDGVALVESLTLPVPLRMEDIRVASVSRGTGQEPPEILVRDLSLAGRWSDELVLERFAARVGDENEVSASARLALTAPFATGLELQASLAAATPDATQGTWTVGADGTLSELRVMARAGHAPLSVEGVLTGLLTNPAWELELLADRLALVEGDTPVHAERIAGSSAGWIDAYRLDLAADVIVGDEPPLEVTLGGAGNAGGIDIEFARVGHPAGRLAAAGRIDWLDAGHLRLSGEVSDLDLSHWNETWPAAHPVQGRFTLDWTGAKITVTEMDFSAHGTPLTVSGSGTWDPDAGRVAADIAWQGLSWPLADPEPRLEDSSGQLRVDGEPDDWTAEGRVTLRAADLPPGTLRIAATGDTGSARVLIQRGEVLGGELAGEFEARWAGDPNWSAHLDIERISTSPLLPDYPGVVSGRLTVAGEPGRERIDILIERLEGDLRGRPVRAEGRLTVEAGVPRARGLAIRSGDSSLRLDGHPRQSGGLAMSLDFASLGDWLDDAEGALEGEARLRWAGDVPTLHLDATGRDLAWGDLRLAALRATSPEGTGGGVSLTLALQSLRIGDYEIGEVTVDAGGDTPLQHIRADATIDGTRLHLLLDGGVTDWRRPLEAGWAGRVEELRAEHPTLGFLELREPAALMLSGENLSLEDTCFRGTRDGRICARAAWRSGGDLMVNADLETISLDILRLFATTDLALTQRLTGTFAWRKPATGQPAGEVNIQVSPGEVRFPNDEDSVIRTGAGAIEFTVTEGRLQGGRLVLPVVDAGRLASDFGASDLSRGAGTPLDAHVRVELADISPFARLVPSLDRLEGEVSADLRIAGTVANPILTGHATLVRGRIEHYASGLALRDIQLAGAVYEYDFTELNGTFQAGDGQGRIRATLGFGNWLKPKITLDLSGSNLTLVDVPDLRLISNPDLHLRWEDGIVHIDGRLEVPEAELSPRYLPGETASESADLVIVAGGEPVAEEPAAETAPLKLKGQVDVVLGEDVSVTLERARAEFGGSVSFIWDETLVPIGDGTFTMTGEINAYGQRLQITEGRIRFPRRPADNPYLNIRAEREIYGNRQINAAGVLITGTLEQPVLEAYTSPMTTQERALTLLVTGKEFDYEQGVGGVEVGMYVAPRLYVSYGIGLFDEQNVISARYDLKRGFGVKATSGQRDSGVDISYTVDK